MIYITREFLVANTLLQWIGFVLIVASTWLYTSRPQLAAIFAGIGCTSLACWCLIQPSVPLGLLFVQVVVGLISVRNTYVFDRRGLPGIIIGFIAFWISVSPGHATYKPEYDKNPEAVKEWFKMARTTPQAGQRLDIYYCCEQAERLRTKFVASKNGEWAYFPDPNCVTSNCKTMTIPNDIVHSEGIKAKNLDDDKLPQFDAMRREGVLFIYNGVPTCFWPPEGNDG